MSITATAITVFGASAGAGFGTLEFYNFLPEKGLISKETIFDKIPPLITTFAISAGIASVTTPLAGIIVNIVITPLWYIIRWMRGRKTTYIPRQVVSNQCFLL